MTEEIKVKKLTEALAWCMRQLDSIAIVNMTLEVKGPLERKEYFEEKFAAYRHTSSKNAELVLGEIGAQEMLRNARIDRLISFRDNARADVQVGPVAKGGEIDGVTSQSRR